MEPIVMSSSSSQQWARRIRYTDQHIRVSDAERQAVADRLGAHFADGRLDQAEFDERVTRTMAAKTRGDLEGLFDDLPDLEPTGAPGSARTGGSAGPSTPYRPRRRGGILRPLALVILVLVAASATWHAVASIYIPWFWITVLALVVLFATRSSRARRDK
jgi:hypothetical protein